MRYLLKLFTLVLLAILVSPEVSAQFLIPEKTTTQQRIVPIDDGGGGTPVSVSISGPSSVDVNDYDYYYVSVSGGIHHSSNYILDRGVAVSQSKSQVRVRWTSAGTGTVAVSAYVSGNYYLDQKSVLISEPPPSRPPEPSISSNQCGNRTVTRSNPPSGVTYYWQTSSGGTSTGNSNTTYTVTSSRSIYLRARDHSSGLWSSTRSVSVLVNPKPSRPSSPSVQNNCGNTKLTRGNPPSGVTWYWQTSAGGTSTGNSSSTWTRTSSGTVYLRAKHDNGCWSSSRSVSVSIKAMPSTPSSPTVQNNCESTVLTRSNPPSGVTWYWQTSAGGTSTGNSSSTWTRASSGTVYLRAKHNNGCWSSSRSVSVSIKAKPSTPSSPTVQNNCESTILTRSNPPSGVTWYWQTSSGGTSTGNSSSTWTRASSGTVYLRAKHDNGCWSSERLINVAVETFAGAAAITGQSYVNEGGVDLTREDPPSGESWYWQGTDPNGTSTTNTSKTLRVKTTGTYYLRARSNVSNCWGNTDMTTVTLNTQPPTSVNALVESSEAIVISWQGSGVAEYYLISRSTSSTGPFNGVYTAPSDETTYTDEGLQPGTRYYYQVQSLVDQEYSTPSVVASSQTAGSDGVNDDLNFEPQYNGNIAAIKWKSSGDNRESLYTYHYDPMNRITASHYAEQSAPDVWNIGVGNYQVHNIGYDLNGNIETLTRNGLDAGAAQVIDQLAYTYEGNQLQFVEDEDGIAETKGFINGHLGSEGNEDYDYDPNGNMTKDLNKEITDIQYNYLNLPERVEKADGQYIKYIYDAAGIKLAQEVYDASDDLIKKTEYIGEFIYETDNQDNTELALIQHEEGRIVHDEINGDWEYQYYLKDHLGNTRVTFTTKPKTWTFEGSFETESAADEESTYDNLPETRVTFNSADANSDGGNEVVRVNNAQPMGAGLSLPVGVGDTLSMEVYGYYEGGSGYNTDVGLATFIGAVAGGFGGINGGTEAQQATFDAFNNSISGIGFTGTSDDLVPAAYLNYILFDENMVYYQHGHVQISSAANMNHEQIAIDDVVADKTGFVFIYLSNESDSPNPVYFDDMTVTLSEHPVLETTDYYPYGMAHSGGFKRVTAKENRFKYNGKELQEETGTYDYGQRMYDPALGRFWRIDRRSHNYMMYSPYSYVANNPINNIDYNGDFILPKEFLQRFERAAQYLANDIQGLLNNKRVVNALKKHGGFTDKQLQTAFTWGQGPVITPGKFADSNILGMTGGIPGDISLSVNMDLFEALEKAEGKDRDHQLFLLAVTILHEFVHYGYIDNEMDNDAIEEGYDFERDAYGQVINRSNYKQFLDDWLEKYKEQQKKEQAEAEKKGKAANELINNFGSLEEGTYEWNGTDFVKVD